ncbi:hypothetical protein LR032_05310 [Candidatus Bipolaricaulota bacterium]|nr:hypothetical protein [Candidatus Bipolaricaulota bacterium]
MRMNKLVVGMLVLALVVSVVGMVGFASQSSARADSRVTWTVQRFIELRINSNNFDFGAIASGLDTITRERVHTLSISSNTRWVLTFAVSGRGSDHLGVRLSASQGNDNGTVTVDYTLSNLRKMDPGNYSVTVTYTVTTR